MSNLSKHIRIGAEAIVFALLVIGAIVFINLYGNEIAPYVILDPVQEVMNPSDINYIGERLTDVRPGSYKVIDCSRSQSGEIDQLAC